MKEFSTGLQTSSLRKKGQQPPWIEASILNTGRKKKKKPESDLGTM